MREQLQKLCVETWKNNGFHGTVVLPTGTGKTKVGVMAMQSLDWAAASILVVVPRIPLKDQWLKECTKWGYDPKKVRVECINSVYKVQSEYDLIVVDEIHRTLSDQFIQMYDNIKFKWMLGLTATEPASIERRALLDKVCPVVIKRDINDSLNIGAVSEFKVFNLAATLSKEVQYKYNLFNTQFNKGMMILSRIRSQIPEVKRTYSSAFDIAKAFKGGYGSNLPHEIHKQLVEGAKLFWSGMTLRKKVLYDNQEKISMVRQIYLKYPKDKWIIFTKTIDIATKISGSIPNSNLYHSKMKTAEREQVLEDFRQNKFNVLVAVDALNEGLDVPDVDKAISVSGSSTELEQIQRLGRCIRVKEGKKALFINLYVPGTPEERWVRSRTQNLNPTWISKISQIE